MKLCPALDEPDQRLLKQDGSNTSHCFWGKRQVLHLHLSLSNLHLFTVSNHNVSDLSMYPFLPPKNSLTVIFLNQYFLPDKWSHHSQAQDEDLELKLDMESLEEP